jgi:hypothetical protein
MPRTILPGAGQLLACAQAVIACLVPVITGPFARRQLRIPRPLTFPGPPTPATATAVQSNGVFTAEYRPENS